MPQKPTEEMKPIDPIDRIPKIKYNKEKLAIWMLDQRKAMLDDREPWHKRYQQYISQWDDYVTYIRQGPWDDSANLHLPLSMEKMKALHARFKQALFAIRPPWIMLPREPLDIDRVRRIDSVMRWACECYVNHYKGIEPVIDDWIWDFVGIGWGVVKRRWEVLQRNAILTKEITDEERMENMERLNEMAVLQGKPMTDTLAEKVAKEYKELITIFDGPVVETIPHENILFPGSFQDVSDLDQPCMVCHDFKIDASTLKSYQMRGYYDSDAVDKILKRTPPENPDDNSYVLEIKRAQDDYQGVKTVDSDMERRDYPMSECFFRYDIDGDGIDEELVATISLDTREICRLTYLDRITKTGNRPLHKIDFIRRPRRAYSLGLLEMLYPLQTELDAIHNMKMDAATLANIPFFFFRSTSGIKGDTWKIEPGVGYPTDDPQTDVNFPKINSSQYFGNTEETVIDRWADRITSINVMNSGLPSQHVGATRTASGMQALLNEANTNIDTILSHLKNGFSGLLRGILADLQERLPDNMKIRVIGSSGNPVTGPNGEAIFLDPSPTRQDIAGRLDFMLIANSLNSNRELEKQTYMQAAQLQLNPIYLQTGIVTPRNIFHSLKKVYEKMGIMEIPDLITEPQNAQMPLSLYDEIAAVTQGLVPNIVLNDNHLAKIQGLTSFSQEEEFMRGVQLGVNSPDAPQALNIAIGIHKSMNDAVQAQAQQANTTGLQISPSLGARISGQVGETGRPLPQENVPRGEAPRSQQALESAEGETAGPNTPAPQA